LSVFNARYKRYCRAVLAIFQLLYLLDRLAIIYFMHGRHSPR
jgi:hypothetical protein